MLLVCPSCRTRYIVPDAAIGPTGRQVRCASCKHSWFQDGAATAPHVQAEAIAPGFSALREPDVPAFVERPEPRGEQNEAAVAPREKPAERGSGSLADEVPPPSFSALRREAPSSYDYAPPFRARRNPARLRTIAAAVFAVLLSLLGGAVWYFGLLADSLPFATHEPDLEIVLAKKQDRQTLRDGTEYFAASGSIVNSGTTEQTVPPLLVILRDASGRVVYKWKMKPPVATLAPGARVEFNEAKLDVPRAARQLQVGWAEGGE
jgi:predicted Zn finger-like uncharacterized protein